MKRYSCFAVAAVLCVCLAGAAVVADEPVTLLKPYDADGLEGRISLDKPTYSVGEQIKTTVTISCQRNSRRLYNPMFNGLLEMPGWLRVFDKSGKLVWEYFKFHDGSRRGSGDEDWVFLWENSFIGTTLRLSPLIGMVANKPFPPGDYKMQLVLTRVLEVGEKSLPSGGNRWDIIAASEPVSFKVIVPPAGASSPAAPGNPVRQ